MLLSNLEYLELGISKEDDAQNITDLLSARGVLSALARNDSLHGFSTQALQCDSLYNVEYSTTKHQWYVILSRERSRFSF